MDITNKILTDSLNSSNPELSQTIALRINQMRQWAQSLRESQSEQDPMWQKAIMMIDYQCRCAKQHLQGIHQLPGVTGESNELWLEPRGKTAIIIGPSMPVKAITATLTATLISGNQAILFIHETFQPYTNGLIEQIKNRFAPPDAIELCNYQDWSKNIKDPEIKMVCIAAPKDEIINANRILSTREGEIIPLLYDSDEKLPQFSKDSFCIHFNTEKVCTINTTAIGGNASLLEISSAKV
ncbi:hypothetical protein [Celerinatantimonas sp. YJH-8]|uniref:hypothetical protein n=1 Tax=Celerinatantimonas sp. YJH-8 TaxID=3228714 RepID=UPI0038C3B9EB